MGGGARRPAVMASIFTGVPFRLGLAAAVTVAAVDQAVKAWLLWGFELGGRGQVAVAPLVDLVLAWNTGISYGMFQESGPLGQALLLAFKLAAVVVLSVWLMRTRSRLTGAALGLIIGGAVGNMVDRALYGAVVDFVLLHATVGGRTFYWYVFNLADAAIVAGVAGLIYESLFMPGAAKAP